MANETENADPKILWIATAPTIMTDALVAMAQAGGVFRFAAVEAVYDPTDGAHTPTWRQTANLAVPFAALDNMIQFLTAARDSIRKSVEVGDAS